MTSNIRPWTPAFKVEKSQPKEIKNSQDLAQILESFAQTDPVFQNRLKDFAKRKRKLLHQEKEVFNFKPIKNDARSRQKKVDSVKEDNIALNNDFIEFLGSNVITFAGNLDPEKIAIIVNVYMKTLSQSES